jgi:hypothetical protein
MKRTHAGGLGLMLAAQLLAPGIALAVPDGSTTQRVPETAAVTLDSPASELRVLLGRLLSEHAFLTMEQMRAIADDRPDAAAAAKAVDANTADLSAAIGSVYGDDAGSQFADLWDGHVNDLELYAEAVRDGDTAAQEEAHRGLETYRREFSDWLAAANPNVTAEGVADLLHLHTDQLTSYLDDDFEAAFLTERQAFAHMFETGDTLASAIISQFPDRFPGRGEGFSPAVGLWLALDRLLGEHLILAAEAMRAGHSAAAEFDAASDALNDNSADLASSIGSIYGAEAGEAFESLWSEHIDAYLAYIEAIRDEDEAAQEEHRSVLAGYADRFGEFLAAANPHLEAGSVSRLVEHHALALLEQVDAYAEGDYDRAYSTVREAYAHMFDVGKALAIALSEQFPARFPALPASSTEPAADKTPLSPVLPTALLVIAVVMRVFSRAVRPSPRG